MKAIIIGAGIAGLAMAKGLQALNWEVQIYDQAPALKPAGAGIVLSANALSALQSLGLYEAVAAKGNPIAKVDILSNKGILLSSTKRLIASRPSGQGSDLSLHRSELQQALLSQLHCDINCDTKDKKEAKESAKEHKKSGNFKAAQGLKIHTGKRLLDLQQTKEGVTLTFQDGERQEADLLFGCDGIHSVVREAIFPGAAKRYSGYTCWRGISQGLPGSQKIDESSESWGRGKRFGIVPLSNQRVYWFACLNAGQPKDEQMAKIKLEELQKIFADFHEPVQEILQHTPAEALLWNDIIDLKPIDSFSKNRVVLLGDAAHATTPNMGQGACQSLEDAAVLTSLLQKNGHQYEAAFREYNRLRIPRAHMVVNRSWQLGKIAQWKQPLACSLRNLLVRSIPEKMTQKQLDQLFNIQFEPLIQG